MLKLLKIFIITLMMTSCGQKDDKLSELIVATDNGPVVYKVESAVTKEANSFVLIRAISEASIETATRPIHEKL